MRFFTPLPVVIGDILSGKGEIKIKKCGNFVEFSVGDPPPISD